MAFIPNERLAYEAIKRRDSIANGPQKDIITKKGIREMAALFALRDSRLRGEQPEGLAFDPIGDCQILAMDVDKLIPKVEGTE